MRFDVIDGCPVPRDIAPFVAHLKRAVPGARLQSCYRGDQAAGLLRRLHKSTQSMLGYGWSHRLKGFLPANPPGRSTHELRSDGVAYRGPVGRPLRAWQVGLDYDDAHVDQIIAAAHRAGWDLRRPYEAGSEYRHLNFARKPRWPKAWGPAR